MWIKIRNLKIKQHISKPGLEIIKLSEQKSYLLSSRGKMMTPRYLGVNLKVESPNYSETSEEFDVEQFPVYEVIFRGGFGEDLQMSPSFEVFIHDSEGRRKILSPSEYPKTVVKFLKKFYLCEWLREFPEDLKREDLTLTPLFK
jgi:hypothetical protein